MDRNKLIDDILFLSSVYRVPAPNRGDLENTKTDKLILILEEVKKLIKTQ